MPVDAGSGKGGSVMPRLCERNGRRAEVEDARRDAIRAISARVRVGHSAGGAWYNALRSVVIDLRIRARRPVAPWSDRFARWNYETDRRHRGPAQRGQVNPLQ